MLKQRSLIIGLLVISIMTCISLSIFAYNAINITLIDYKDDPKQHALDDIDLLLKSIKSHPNEPMPNNDKNLPSYLWVNEDCWTLIQGLMKENSNRYVLQVAEYYNSRDNPNSVHDLIEVYVQVSFPNNRRIEVLFSQGGLKGCRELKNKR